MSIKVADLSESAVPCRSISRLPQSRSLDLTLVLPTYREAKSIAKVLERFTEVMARRPEVAYEIIVVDDDSPDQTWRIASELSERLPHIRVVRRRGERGLATAVVAGWCVGRGGLLAVMDADLQHPPELLLDMLDAVEPGVDLVAGSRHVPGGGVSDWKLRRRIISRGAQLLGLVILPEVVGRVNDPMSGCFIVRREALVDRVLRPRGYKILLEVLARAELRGVREVPYVFCERRDGESKATPAVYADYVVHLAKLRLDRVRSGPLPRFAAVGFGGLLIDMGLFFLLGDPAALGWNLVPAKLLAAECALLSNFALHHRWTRGGLRPHGTTQRHDPWRSLLKFQSICAMGMLLGLVVLMLAVQLGVNRYPANLAAVAAAALWNYPIIQKLGWGTTAP